MSLALLYTAAFAAYVWHFVSRRRLAGRMATGLLLLAVLVHTFVLGMYTMELGVPPMAGRTGAVSTVVWMLAISYLSIEVSNLETALKRARKAGIPIEYGPASEPWGVRRFFVRDPFGKLVNILQHE